MVGTFQCPNCGTALSYPPSGTTIECPACHTVANVPDRSAQLGEIRRLVLANDKLEAIKLYRSIYPVNLGEAKEAVEALAAGGALPVTAPDAQTASAAPADAGDHAHALAQIKQLMLADKKIEAIKLYRSIYLVGLVEAKTMVEALEAGGELPMPTAPAAPVDSGDQAKTLAAIRQLMLANQKIEAIKLYRGIYKVGLKEAKDAVEAMAAGVEQILPPAPVNSTGQAMGYDPLVKEAGVNKGMLVFGVAVVILVLVALAVWALAGH